MKIIGLEELVFGVDDVAGCGAFLVDYGLDPAGNGRYEAEDGTAVVLAPKDDPALPPPPGPRCLLRRTVLAVPDAETLQAIAAELSKDRAVTTLPDGSLASVDDTGFALGFAVTKRRALEPRLGELSNAPGSPLLRAVNQPGVDPQGGRIRPRTLSHVVYFVPDVAKAEAFYVERLGFRCTDRFVGAGPFLRPAGTLDHHTHFFIGAPPPLTGLEHFTFHFAGPTEVLRNGSRFVEKGAQAFWGPGRHLFGSNWFWYFNSPLLAHIEMDADMDLHDDAWTPRTTPISADASQAFLLRYRAKWIPGPGTPPNGDYA